MCHLLPSFKCSTFVPTFYNRWGNTSATFRCSETFLIWGLCKTKQAFPSLANYRQSLQQPFSPALLSLCIFQSFLYPSLYELGTCYTRLKCHVPISKLYCTALICHIQPSASPVSLPIWTFLQLCLCSPSGWERCSWACLCLEPTPAIIVIYPLVLHCFP